MHIAKIRLENFARYVDQTIELDPGFNAIVGTTDSGKSTILRALIWVMYNRPIGQEMRRFNTEETRVTLWTSDNHEVTRVRSDKRNAYILDGQPYDSVKSDVPQDVQVALGVHMAELGPKNFEMLSVSRQLDGPFMLTGSGGDAAKILGNLAGITTIDIALNNLRPDTQEISNRLKIIDKAELNYKISIVEFEDLAEKENRLNQISLKLNEIREKNFNLDRLKRVSNLMALYNDQVTTIDSKIDSIAKILSYNSQIKSLSKENERLQNFRALEKAMLRFNQETTTLDKQINLADSELKDLKNRHKLLLEEAGTCPTCGAVT